jgi:hypothetical protein
MLDVFVQGKKDIPVVILLLGKGFLHHNLPTQGIPSHSPYMAPPIEEGIILEFHSLKTFGIETHETDDMGSQLRIGIEPSILFCEIDPREVKGFNIRRLFRRNFSLNPFKRSMALQPLSQFFPIAPEDGGKIVGCSLHINHFRRICINGIDLDADGQFIPLPIVNGPPFRSEWNLDLLLLSSQFIELFLFQHLKLKHSPDDEYEKKEEKNRDEDDPDFEPIDRFPLHRITIT